MSIPQNHHYVSQIHLKQFFDQDMGIIYVYDKQRNNLYSKNTTKSLFSEKNLNTRNIEGQLDHRSLEEDLNKYFENDFEKNLLILKGFIQDTQSSDEVYPALTYFARYGVVGDFRTPRYKENTSKLFEETLLKIFKDSATITKESIEDMFSYKKGGQFSNLLDYSEISEKVLQLMGKLIFSIVIPSDAEDFFIVPDCSSVIERAKINEYFDPDIREIAYIGIPLTSKIYIHIFSEKLFTDKRKPVSISYVDSEEVRRLNSLSIAISASKVAAINKPYLEGLIVESQTNP